MTWGVDRNKENFNWIERVTVWGHCKEKQFSHNFWATKWCQYYNFTDVTLSRVEGKLKDYLNTMDNVCPVEL